MKIAMNERIVIDENVIENEENVDEHEAKDYQQNRGGAKQYVEHHLISRYPQGQSWGLLQDARNSQAKDYHWNNHICAQVE